VRRVNNNIIISVGLRVAWIRRYNDARTLYDAGAMTRMIDRSKPTADQSGRPLPDDRRLELNCRIGACGAAKARAWQSEWESTSARLQPRNARQLEGIHAPHAAGPPDVYL